MAALIRSPWYMAPLVWARGLFAGSPREEAQVVAGASFVGGSPTAQEYDPLNALSASAGFPWVRACVDAICDDLAGLPWVVRKGKGSKAVRLDEHPALDLLAQPTSWQTGAEWERQRWLYLLLTGNAYAVIVGERTPSALPLLFPSRTSIRPAAWGAPAAYVNPATGDEWPAEAVIHWRLSSWQDNAEALFGEGLIRALHADLNADLAAAKLNAKAANRWRPDAIISPADEGDAWDEPVRKAIGAAYEAQIARGGALVLGGAAKVDHPDLKPRDLEYGGQRVLTRETVLAAFGVPPGRVGLPNANYATQVAQDTVYWQGLQARARLDSARLTRALGRRWGDDVTVEKDFSGVPALQAQRDGRLARVQVMVRALGADPAEAAAYEGMPDLPVGTPAAPPAADPAPAPTRNLLTFRRSLDAPSTEAERAALWQSWVDEVHSPAEADVLSAVGAELTDQAERVAARLVAVWPERRAVTRNAVVGRDLLGSIMAAIWPVVESAALGLAAATFLRSALEVAFGWSLQRMRLDPVAFDPARLDAEVNASLGSMVTASTDTTRAAVQAAVEQGLREGLTVREVQNRLKNLPQFGVARALAVARTETTRALNAGNQEALRHGVSVGARVRKMWLSARDMHVRDAHVALDGQVVAAGEHFTVPADAYVPLEYHGAQALYPGDFDQAGLVVNCRCTTVPVRAA